MNSWFISCSFQLSFSFAVHLPFCLHFILTSFYFTLLDFTLLCFALLYFFSFHFNVLVYIHPIVISCSFHYYFHFIFKLQFIVTSFHVGFSSFSKQTTSETISKKPRAKCLKLYFALVISFQVHFPFHFNLNFPPPSFSISVQTFPVKKKLSCMITNAFSWPLANYRVHMFQWGQGRFYVNLFSSSAPLWLKHGTSS